MPERNLGLLKGVYAVCFLIGVLNVSAHAQQSQNWSGRIEYVVSPGDLEATRWDYLPQTITYETDGTHWRIDERGTSFERIWLGQHGASTYRVLFHFLGHAVELLETCPSTERSDSRDFKEKIAPCPWQSEARHVLKEQMTLTDGPARYTIEQSQMQSMVRRYWPKGHFDLPEGYEATDKIGLAGLLSRLDSGVQE